MRQVCFEYCSAVWSPYCKTHIQALERVETFAARVVTHNWKMDRSSLLASLQWSSLESRRKTQSLKVCFNIVNNLSIIPPSYFSFHPHPSPRRPHNFILYKPFARTNSYLFSFLLMLFRCGINYLTMLSLVPLLLLLNVNYLSFIFSFILFSFYRAVCLLALLASQSCIVSCKSV